MLIYEQITACVSQAKEFCVENTNTLWLSGYQILIYLLRTLQIMKNCLGHSTKCSFNTRIQTYLNNTLN